MGLFGSDLIESDPVITLTERFGLDLQHMIQKNRKLLLDAKRTHGITAVMNCIEIYVNTLSRQEKYNHMSISGRDIWNGDYRYVTLIKGCIWVVLRTRPFNPITFSEVFISSTNMDLDEIGRGSITIILNEDLTEWKYGVKLY